MAKKLQKQSAANRNGGGKLLSELRSATLERIKRQEEKKTAAKSEEEKKELAKTVSNMDKRRSRRGTINMSKEKLFYV